MTGNLYLDFLISIAGITIMVGISWLIGALRTIPVEEGAAKERLAFDEPDFAPRRWLLSCDGKAAAAVSDREAAFVFANGDSLATRRYPLGAFGVSAEGETVIAAIPDPSKSKIRLTARDAAEAADWTGRLGL